jgi:hypothetical protein
MHRVSGGISIPHHRSTNRALALGAKATAGLGGLGGHDAPGTGPGSRPTWTAI